MAIRLLTSLCSCIRREVWGFSVTQKGLEAVRYLWHLVRFDGSISFGSGNAKYENVNTRLPQFYVTYTDNAPSAIRALYSSGPFSTIGMVRRLRLASGLLQKPCWCFEEICMRAFQTSKRQDQFSRGEQVVFWMSWFTQHSASTQELFSEACVWLHKQYRLNE